MERLARDDAFAVHDLVVGDVVDVGVAGDVTLFLVVRLKLAKQLCSRLELTWRELLVAHHQDVPLGKGADERGARFAIDRLGEVEAGDFGGRVIRQGRDGEGRHGRLPAKACDDPQRSGGHGTQVQYALRGLAARCRWIAR